MQLQAGNWINHPNFGLGRIHDDSNSYLVIRFIGLGEKKISKGFDLAPATPPIPESTSSRIAPRRRPSANRRCETQCIRCEDVFPSIMEVMEELCRESRFATHGAIVDRLMERAEVARIIELAAMNHPHLTRWQIASNMVQWMSQHVTEGREDADVFAERFERHKDERGNWVYSFRET